jgi:hypothetical protein
MAGVATLRGPEPPVANTSCGVGGNLYAAGHVFGVILLLL